MNTNRFIFVVIYLKAVHLASQNERSTESVSRHMVVLARHCPLTGCYFEPCNVPLRQPRLHRVGFSIGLNVLSVVENAEITSLKPCLGSKMLA